MAVLGVDFGTTNTVVTRLDADGSVTTMQHAFGAAEIDVIRSVLCFWNDGGRDQVVLRSAVGPAAIEAYLDDPLDSRLMMSLKSYLAQRSFSETRVFGRPFTLERLIGLFLGGVLPAPDGTVMVAGRPVRFAGDTPDDALGEERLRGAYAVAGWSSVQTALEPEAAGYRFARRLTAPATVLIGDFGGGTSDFSVLRFAPGSARPVVALGHAGVGIAGDTFDYRIMGRGGFSPARQGDDVSAGRDGSAGAAGVLREFRSMAPVVSDAGTQDDARYRGGGTTRAVSGSVGGPAAADPR